MLFEICVDSVAGVHAAKDAGAHRVELCADLLEGGITPSQGMIRIARAIEGIRMHVIIRPRGGDFLYDADEFAVMEADIDVAKQEGADGVVIGLLKPDGTIDIERTQKFIDRARPLAVTFHRAFDMTPDPFAALDTLISLGVERVLTSGQEATVLEGLPLLEELTRRAGERIIVMPGGGITTRNAARIAAALRPREMHFAALTEEPGAMRYRREHVFMGGELRPPEFSRFATSADMIRGVMAKASG
jgi:copper homeostasis protein